MGGKSPVLPFSCNSLKRVRTRVRTTEGGTTRVVAPGPRITNGAPHHGQVVVSSLPIIAIIVRPRSLSLNGCIGVNRRRAEALRVGPKCLCMGSAMHPACTVGSRARTIRGKGQVMIATPLPLVPVCGNVPKTSVLTRVLLRGCRCRIPFCQRIGRPRRLKIGLSEGALGN